MSDDERTTFAGASAAERQSEHRPWGDQTTSGAPAHRRMKVAGAVLALLGASTIGVVACTHKSDDDVGMPKQTTTTMEKLPQPSAELTLKLGKVTVESGGPEVKLEPAIAKRAQEIANAYVQTAVLDPLVTGKVGTKFEKLFGISVLARVREGGRDRSVLTEEGTPRATGPAKAEGATLTLTALADQFGQIAIVSGRIGFQITVPTAQRRLSINKLGELVMEKAPNGDWLITGYAMIARRGPAGSGTTTTTRANAGSSTTTGGGG
jgi:hypothetical protein